MCDYCSWIDKLLAKAKNAADKAKEIQSAPKINPVIIVHGGPGRIPLLQRTYMLEEVKQAAIQSYENLIKGCHALDAVESAICCMESKKYFNCAYGGSLNADGEVVMDAAIMDSSGEAGCIGAVRDVEHPISLARMVMLETDHVLIAEKGAQKFALDMGVPVMPPGWFMQKSMESLESTIHSEEEEEEGCEESSGELQEIGINESESCDDYGYEKLSEIGQLERDDIEEEEEEKIPQCFAGKNVAENGGNYENLERKEEAEPTMLEVGAVGAVAYDKTGRLASGTSTAGVPGKIVGRMSPIGTVIGCGVFANDKACTCVAGDEEPIYAHAPARRIVESLSSEQNIEKSLHEELEKFEKNIGAIALDVSGKPAVAFKSQHFLWAYCEHGRVYYGFKRGQVFSEKIQGLDRPLDCLCEGVI